MGRTPVTGILFHWLGCCIKSHRNKGFRGETMFENGRFNTNPPFACNPKASQPHKPVLTIDVTFLTDLTVYWPNPFFFFTHISLSLQGHLLESSKGGFAWVERSLLWLSRTLLLCLARAPLVPGQSQCYAQNWGQFPDPQPSSCCCKVPGWSLIHRWLSNFLMGTYVGKTFYIMTQCTHACPHIHFSKQYLPLFLTINNAIPIIFYFVYFSV